MSRKLITFVTPEAGKWIIVTKFDKEIYSILYDPTSDKPEHNPPSLIVLGWPWGQAKIKLRWPEFVSDKETAETAVLKGTDIKKYKANPRTFYNSQLVIGTREEYVDYLNQFETHPGVVEVTSKDGGSVEIIISVVIEILDPIATKKLEDFIGFTLNLVIHAFRQWAAEKKFHELRNIKTDDDKLVPGEIYDRLKVLNKKDFRPKGFWVPRITVNAVSVAHRSKDLLETEENIAKQANNAQAAVYEKDTELQLNLAQEARNSSELKFRKEDAAIKKELVNGSAEALAKINKSWGEGGLQRLFIGGGQSTPMQNLVESHLQVQDFADSDSDDRRRPSRHGKKKGGSTDV